MAARKLAILEVFRNLEVWHPVCTWNGDRHERKGSIQNGWSSERSETRISSAAQESGVQHCRPVGAGAGHRGEYRHFQHRLRRAATALAFREARPARAVVARPA